MTAGPLADVSPAWSPDGRSIAFVRGVNEKRAIYLIPPLRGGERTVADGIFDQMSWSPDGRFLAVPEAPSLQSKSSSLYLIAIESGDKFRLTTPPNATTKDISPAFSPNGRVLLFNRCGGPFHCDLYTLEIATDYRPTGAPRLLRKEGNDIRGAAAWTIDGKEAVYAVSLDGGWNHRLIRVGIGTGAKPQYLKFAGENTGSRRSPIRGTGSPTYST